MESLAINLIVKRTKKELQCNNLNYQNSNPSRLRLMVEGFQEEFIPPGMNS